MCGNSSHLVDIHIFGQGFLCVLLGTVIFLLPRIQSAESLAIGQTVAVILFMILIGMPTVSTLDAAGLMVKSPLLDALMNGRSRNWSSEAFLISCFAGLLTIYAHMPETTRPP